MIDNWVNRWLDIQQYIAETERIGQRGRSWAMIALFAVLVLLSLVFAVAFFKHDD